jgi:uncharacterized membrane protein YdjX (TVP38/TMEM64 family)
VWSNLDSRASVRAPLLGLAIVAVALGLGHLVRAQLDMELSPAGIQLAFAELGAWGPLVFFVLTTFRQFLAIPSWLLLPVGGLCFGTILGTALGGGALVLSGCMKFGVARWLGRDWVRGRLGSSFERFERRVDRLGPVVIGMSTAHPFGVLAPFHWGAGISSIRFGSFVLAIVLGAPVRAFAYAAFGAALVDPTTVEFRTISVGLVGVAVAPFLIPGVRRRLFASD